MITPDVESLRTALHLLGVAVWLGGQIVLAGIVPALRASAPESTRLVARGFARLAWPAMLVIVATGMWTYVDIDATSRDTAYSVTFGLKMLMVGTTVAATVVHSFGSSRAAKAVGGAASLLSALGAAYLGVLLAHAA